MKNPIRMVVRGVGEKMNLIRLPIVLLIIAFLRELIGGFAGMSFETGVQIEMVPLALHLSIVWGALGRSIYGHELGSAAMLGVLICAFAKSLLLCMTMFSYAAGLEIHFNNLGVVAGELRDIAFGEAILWPTIEIVMGAVLGAIWASIGFTLAGFVPIRPGVR